MTSRVVPLTVDEDSRTIEAVMATEQPVKVYDPQGKRHIDEVLLMSGAQFNDSLPLIESHEHDDLDRVRGSVQNIRITGSEMVGDLHFANTKNDERTWSLYRDGHCRGVSVGYEPLEWVDLPPNTSRTIGGVSYHAGSLPLRVTTSWQAKELSLVTVGADKAALTRSYPRMEWFEVLKAHQLLGERGAVVSLKRQDADEWLESGYVKRTDAPEEEPEDEETEREGEEETREDEERSEDEEREMTDEELLRSIDEDIARFTEETEEREEDTDEKVERAVKAELAKRQQTLKVIRKFERHVRPQVIRKAIDEGWTEDEVYRRMSKEMQDNRVQPFAIHSRTKTYGGKDALAAGIMIRNGIDPTKLKPSYSKDKIDWERAANQADGRYDHMSFVDVCEQALRIDGRSVPRRGELFERATGTATFDYAFTNNVYAVVMMSYDNIEDTTQGWVYESTHPNFHKQPHIRLGQADQLERLAPDDEAKQATIEDTQEELQVHRYAKQFAVDEQHMINDRLDIIKSIPTRMGSAAARIRLDLVYNVLAKGNSSAYQMVETGYNVFSGAGKHLNLTTAVLGETGLKAAITAMAKQKDGDVPLNIQPQTLLVPPTLKFTAMQLLNSTEVRNNIDSGGAEYGTVNVLQGIVPNVVTEARLELGGTDPLSQAAYTGSATAWYLFANAQQFPVVAVSYLAGQKAPTVRTYKFDQGKYGMGWDIKHDLGVGYLDYRGAHKSTGAG